MSHQWHYTAFFLFPYPREWWSHAGLRSQCLSISPDPLVAVDSPPRSDIYSRYPPTHTDPAQNSCQELNQLTDQQPILTTRQLINSQHWSVHQNWPHPGLGNRGSIFTGWLGSTGLHCSLNTCEPCVCVCACIVYMYAFGNVQHVCTHMWFVVKQCAWCMYGETDQAN